MDGFLVIAITPPFSFPMEAERINDLLIKGEADFVHIRKPDSSAEEIENLIQLINPEFYPKLKLHDHFEILDKYPLGGIHLNSRNKIPHSKAKSKSASIHSLDEIKLMESMDYFFFSPVYDSISKPGHNPSFKLQEIKDFISGKRAIALGGVTPDKFPELKSVGFVGAALLGHFFHQFQQKNN